MQVKDIMKTNLFTLYESETISDAQDVMILERIRHIPVVNSSFKLVGLITHRDLIRALTRKQESCPVKLIMKKNVVVVDLSIPLRDVIKIMITNKYGCLPVVNDSGKLVGIVTEIDLLKVLYSMIKSREDFFAKRLSKSMG